MENIYLETDEFLLCPADKPEVLKGLRLTEDLFNLLSDKETLRYLPEKHISSVQEAEQWLCTTLLNIHCGRNQTHLIISRNSRRLIGIIDIIPPLVAKEYYRLGDYPYFIEFYLRRSVTGNSLMSNLLPKVVQLLKDNGINSIAAVVHRQNSAACKVLRRSGFQKEQWFDLNQDLYSLSA